jgi:hypothetical protein
MNTKQIQLALVIFGLSSGLIRAADDEARLMQQNPDWHITSEAFTNPPYWLMPTNVPYNLYPLNNGKWVWTTNVNATWYEQSMLSVTMDDTREQQLKLQWLKEHRQMNDANDPPGIANVSEYHGRSWDQKHVWNTNMVENWQGTWVEDANTRWRVDLRFYQTNTPGVDMTVHVGSIVTNSGAGLLPPPDGKYAKLELMDANDKVVPTKPGAALNLYRWQYGGYREESTLVKVSVNLHLPSESDATVERDYPDTISDLEYPRANMDVSRSKKGGFFEISTGFVSNGPPCHIGYIKFNDIFSIKSEGDYTLTVQPVLYRMHYDGGTFQGYLDRVDLPSVTTKVHLIPDGK